MRQSIFSPEEHLVILCSRASPSENARERIRQIVMQRPDFGRVLTLAVKNGVLQLLWKNLRDCSVVPSAFLEGLRNVFLSSAGINVRFLHDTLSLVDLLKKEGIPSIPLKGSIASELIFGHPGLYLGSDIDVLIKENDLDRVKTLLSGKGYSLNRSTEKIMRKIHYHLAFTNDRHTIEVHWNLISPLHLAVPTDFWWEGLVTRQWEGREIPCLQTEKYILYLVWRLFKHEFFPLRFLVIIAELIRRYADEIDWERLYRFSDDLRIRRLLLFTLSLMEDFWQTGIPDPPITEKAPEHRYIKKMVCRGFFTVSRFPQFGKLLYQTLLDSPWDTARVLFRVVIPVPEILQLRYGIPEGSKRLYWMYPIHLLFVPRILFRRNT